MIEEVFLLFILFLTIYVFAWIDDEHFDKNQYVRDHTSRWVLRFLFVIALGFNGYNVDSLINTVGYGLIFSGSFDGVLNLKRGISINHLGSTAKWDIEWKKNMIFYNIFRVASIIVGLYLTLFNI